MSAVRRNASLFVAISTVSGFGSTAMSLAAGIWILDLTGSPGLAGLAGLCVYAPTLAAPWLGGLIDRLPRRRFAVTVDLLLAAVLLTLLLVRSREQTWLIFTVMLAYGLSHVLLDAAESALLPAALPASALGDVNGWRSSAQEGMKLVAPLAGAGLYAWQGGGPVAVVSAVMPLVAAALYGLLRLGPDARPFVAAGGDGRPRPGAGVVVAAGGERPGVGARDVGPGGDERPPAGARVVVAGAGLRRPSGVRAALAVLRGRPETRVTVLIAAVAIGMSGFTTAAVYARVTTGLDLPSAFLGVLSSAQGAGSIAGGLIVGRLIGRRGGTAVAVAGAGLFAAGCLLWCLPGWPTMIAGSVAVGAGLPWTLVAAVTAVQTGTPDHLLGRVAATATTVMFGPIAVTNPLGAVAVQLGARPPLIAAAVVVAGAAAIAGGGPRLRRGRSSKAAAGT